LEMMYGLCYAGKEVAPLMQRVEERSNDRGYLSAGLLQTHKSGDKDSITKKKGMGIRQDTNLLRLITCEMQNTFYLSQARSMR